MYGTISFIPIRYLTDFDLEHADHLHLMDGNVEWNSNQLPNL